MHRSVTVLVLGCFSRFSRFSIAADLDHLFQRKEDCETRGGSLVWVALSMGHSLEGDIFEALLIEPMIENAEEAQNHICIPRNCAGQVEISQEDCANVKGWVLQKLLEAHQNTKGGLGFDHVFHSAIRQHPWMFTGVEDSQILPKLPFAPPISMQRAEDVEVAETLPHRPFRLAILSSHAPVAGVLAEHVEEIVKGPVQVLYYGSCYLCEHTFTCPERRQESLADESCEHFHNPDEVSLQTWLDIAADVARREAHASFLMCFGLALCHFWFSLVSGTPRAQLLCMNPLQGTPKHLAGLMLLDLRRRVMEAKPDDQRCSRLRRNVVFPEGQHNDTWEKGGDEYWKVQATFLQECLSQDVRGVAKVRAKIEEAGQCAASMASTTGEDGWETVDSKGASDS
eukprot:s835_g16.t1